MLSKPLIRNGLLFQNPNSNINAIWAIQKRQLIIHHILFPWTVQRKSAFNTFSRMTDCSRSHVPQESWKTGDCMFLEVFGNQDWWWGMLEIMVLFSSLMYSKKLIQCVFWCWCHRCLVFLPVMSSVLSYSWWAVLKMKLCLMNHSHSLLAAFVCMYVKMPLLLCHI